MLETLTNNRYKGIGVTSVHGITKCLHFYSWLFIWSRLGHYGL